jgi:hypothetical protein
VDNPSPLQIAFFRVEEKVSYLVATALLTFSTGFFLAASN